MRRFVRLVDRASWSLTTDRHAVSVLDMQIAAASPKAGALKHRPWLQETPRCGARLACVAFDGKYPSSTRDTPSSSKPRYTVAPELWNDEAWGEVGGQQREAGVSPAGGVASTSHRSLQRHSKARPVKGRHAPPDRLPRSPSSREAWESDSHFDEGRTRRTEQRQISSAGRSRPAHLSHKERVQVILRSNTELRDAFMRFKEDMEGEKDGTAAAQQRLQTFLDELHHIVAADGQYFDDVNCAIAMRYLAAALDAAPPGQAAVEAGAAILARVIDASLANAASFRIGAVRQVLGGLVRVSPHGRGAVLPAPGTAAAARLDALLEALAEKAWRRFTQPPDVESLDIVLTLWGFSRLGPSPLDGRLVTAAVRALEPQLRSAEPQHLSMLIVALAAFGDPVPDSFLASVASCAVLTMPRASAQVVANLLWGFVKLTGASPLRGDLLRAAVSRALEVEDTLEVQHVGHILWAAATVEHPLSSSAIDRLAVAAVRRMRDAQSATVGSILSAARKLDVSPLHGRLVLAALEQGERRLDNCTCHTLTTVLWAISGDRVHLPDGALRALDGKWAQRALALLTQADDEAHWGQHVGLTLLAYSRLRLDPLQGSLFAEVLRLLSGRLHLLTAQNASNVLLAMATLRKAAPPSLLRQISGRITVEGNTQEVCNTLWSLTVFRALDESTMDALVQRLEALGASEGMRKQDAHQLLMADAALRLLTEEPYASRLPPDLAAAAKLALKDKEVIVSGFHEEVSATLAALGVPHALEFASPDGLLSIDVVARASDGGPLAIEVDGDTHFTALPPYRPLGGTALRNRLIAAHGFRGVGVPFYDWKRLSNAAERAAYLAARLEKWGAVPGSGGGDAGPVAATAAAAP